MSDDLFSLLLFERQKWDNLLLDFVKGNIISQVENWRSVLSENSSFPKRGRRRRPGPIFRGQRGGQKKNGPGSWSSSRAALRSLNRRKGMLNSGRREAKSLLTLHAFFFSPRFFFFQFSFAFNSWPSFKEWWRCGNNEDTLITIHSILVEDFERRRWKEWKVWMEEPEWSQVERVSSSTGILLKRCKKMLRKEGLGSEGEKEKSVERGESREGRELLK